MANVKDVNLSVNVFPIEEPLGNTMAFASVAVDDLIAIRGIRVVDSENGLFVSMPQSQDKAGEFHDIAFPLNGELRRAMETAILDKYAAELGIDKPERKPSLNVRVRDGKKKAAEQPKKEADMAAKSRAGSTLE
jgi:stage V sporulation protein G